MIIRVKFNKKNYLKYISHLDLMRLFQRSFNRANIPVKYSKGFNPQPKFSIGAPLSLGIESEEEYMDIDLEYMPVAEFIDRMNRVLPEDIQIISGKYLKREESLNSIIAWSNYEIQFKTDHRKSKEEINKVIDNWLLHEKIMITKIRKKKGKEIEKEINIRPFIGNVIVKDVNNNITISVLLKTGSNGNLNPMDFVNVLNRDCELNIDMDTISIKRLALYAEKGDELYKPL
ncbi:MAG: DUF2344 domain-containing protein [Tissierellia bacterium]|nr:DUF2344 domain-containing protein [Tissierellia bacterium]